MDKRRKKYLTVEDKEALTLCALVASGTYVRTQRDLHIRYANSETMGSFLIPEGSVDLFSILTELGSMSTLIASRKEVRLLLRAAFDPDSGRLYRHVHGTGIERWQINE